MRAHCLGQRPCRPLHEAQGAKVVGVPVHLFQQRVFDQRGVDVGAGDAVALDRAEQSPGVEAAHADEGGASGERGERASQRAAGVVHGRSREVDLIAWDRGRDERQAPGNAQMGADRALGDAGGPGGVVDRAGIGKAERNGRRWHSRALGQRLE